MCRESIEKKEVPVPTTRIISAVRVIRDVCGQDMIEYALIAGFLATFAVRGSPGAADAVDATAQKVSISAGLRGATPIVRSARKSRRRCQLESR